MPARLLFADPVVQPRDAGSETVMVVYGLANPELADMAAHSKEFAVTSTLQADIAAYSPTAQAELAGAIESLFPGQYSLDAPYPVPASVGMGAARIALHRAGLLAQVDTAINAMTDATAQAEARIWWEYASEVRRSDALIASLGAALGMNDAAIDDLFRTAAAL